MTASDMTGDIKFSGATLQLFEDSGWYSLNSNANEDYLNWGKGRGCEFVKKTCKGGVFAEFCAV